MRDFQSAIAKATGKRELLEKQLGEYQVEAKTSGKLQENLTFLQKFFQETAQETQEQLRFHIQDIVQLSLDSCFPDAYEFRIDFSIARGKTEANIYFLKDGQPVSPMDSAGGGAVDMVAFGLRLACWTLSRSDNVIILDEPFRFLSKDLQPSAGAIMRELAKKLDLQFVMVTHSSEMIEISDRVFKVSMRNGCSRVRKAN